jgi:tetratricopeptide (TPR) repeat protein
LSRTALARSPYKPDILFLLALGLHMQRKLDEAVPVYRILTGLQPDSAVHWSNHASALTDAGDLEEAERAFRRAIELDPENIDSRRTGVMGGLRRHVPEVRDCDFHFGRTRRRATAPFPIAGNTCLCNMAALRRTDWSA